MRKGGEGPVAVLDPSTVGGCSSEGGAGGVDVMRLFGGKVLSKILGGHPSVPDYAQGICRSSSLKGSRCVGEAPFGRDVKRRSAVSIEGVIASPRCQKRGFQTTHVHRTESEYQKRAIKAVNSSKIKNSVTLEGPEDGLDQTSKTPKIPFNDGLWSIMLMRPASVEALSPFISKSAKKPAENEESREHASGENGGGQGVNSMAPQLSASSAEEETLDIAGAKDNTQYDDVSDPHEGREPVLAASSGKMPESVDLSESSIGLKAAVHINSAALMGSKDVGEEGASQRLAKQVVLSQEGSHDGGRTSKDRLKPDESVSQEKNAGVDEVPPVEVLNSDGPEPQKIYTLNKLPLSTGAYIQHGSNLEDKIEESVIRYTDTELIDFTGFQNTIGYWVTLTAAIIAVILSQLESLSNSGRSKKSLDADLGRVGAVATAAASTTSNTTKGSSMRKSGANNNNHGKSSAGASQGYNQSSLSGGIGSGGGSGGGGGGSDGDDNWRNLPDEPADGFGPGDAQGFLLVVAAVALVGSAIHWVRRIQQRRNRNTRMCRQELIAGGLRGGGLASAVSQGNQQGPQHTPLAQEVTVSQATTANLHEAAVLNVDESISTKNIGHVHDDSFELVEAKSETTRALDMSQYIAKSNGLQTKSVHEASTSAASVNSDDVEISALRKHVGDLEEQITKSDRRRRDVQKNLAVASACHNTETASLRAELKGQEEQNMKIQAQFAEVDQERMSLAATVKDAETSLALVRPQLNHTMDELARLGEIVKVQKAELLKYRHQMGDSQHEQGVMQRRLHNKEMEVQEMDGFVGTIERIEKDLSGANSALSPQERMERISSGLKTIRSMENRSKHSRQLTLPIQGMLMRLREAISDNHGSEEEFTKLKEHLKSSEKCQQELRATIEELQMKVRDLVGEKDILQSGAHLLRNSFEEKCLILEEVKLKHDSAETSIHRGEAERDRLVRELDEKKADLREANGSLLTMERRNDEAKAQVEQLVEEKKSLHTQLTGLRHKVDLFEVEAQRLNSDANALRSNLQHEKSTQEGLETKIEDLTGELLAAKQSLINVRELQNLEEKKKTLEAAREKLEETRDAEISELKDHIKKLEEDANENARVAMHQSGAQELNRIMERAMEKGLKVDPAASATSYASYVQQAAPDGHPPGPMAENESRVLAWIKASAEERSSAPHSPQLSPLYTPLFKQETDSGHQHERSQALMTGTTEPAEKPKHPPRQRRGSWPQDMSTMISDHLFGAAQEVVDLTGAQVDISHEKEALVKDLDESKRLISQTATKLDEKDKDMSDLTEHFLQVYQIASNLATENDNAMLALEEARLESEHLKEELHERNEKISELELRANSRLLTHRVETDSQLDGYGDTDYVMATPRSSVSLGSRSRTALPRPPSRSGGVTPTPQSYPPEIITSQGASLRLDTPSPRSASQMPVGPGSDTTNSAPLRSGSFDGHPSGPLTVDVHAKETVPSALKPEYTTRTSMKRMAPGVPRKK